MKNILFISLFLSLVSCNYKMIDKPGLKGRIKEYTDYKIHIENLEDDSILKDTIFISKSKFNKKGKVVKFEQLSVHSKTTYKNTNIYNSGGRIIKEIGNYNDNEIIVEYVYKDTLLQKVYSKNIIDNEISELTEQYFYDNQGVLKKRKTSSYIIENKDTVSSDIWVNNYDENGVLYKSTSLMNNVLDSMKKTTYKYEYNKLELPLKTFEYDENDSLIVTNVYKYRFDKNGSWIEKENYKNDTLKYLTIRIIEYD